MGVMIPVHRKRMRNLLNRWGSRVSLARMWRLWMYQDFKAFLMLVWSACAAIDLPTIQKLGCSMELTGASERDRALVALRL